jgi:methyl-accepting chemotaxis protein
MRNIGALTGLITDTSALVHEVQRERGYSSGFLGSKGAEFGSELKEQRLHTDQRLTAFDDRVRSVGIDLPAGLTASARDAFGAIGDIRRRIDGLIMTPEESFIWFTSRNTALLNMIGTVTAGVDAPSVARSLAAYLSLLRAKELAGQERAIGAAGFGAGRFDAARLRRLTMLGDQQDLYFRIIAAAIPSSQSEFMARTMTGDAVEAVAKMRRTAAEGGLEGHLDGTTGKAWFAAATARIDLLKLVEDRMSNDLRSMTTGIRDAAQAEFVTAFFAVLGFLVLTAAFGAMTIRAIVRPLHSYIQIMQRLAAGETNVVIAGTLRHDELGSMARAIEVFRVQGVENRELAELRENDRHRAEAEKAAALREMADTIETETTKALACVGEATDAMQSVGEDVSRSASRTDASARSVASAAAQSLMNAQTVASAAEQLTASIQEISAQVGQSAEVVGRAVSAGGETKAAMRQLDGRVARVGAVADMIKDIAEKTNLLALNATPWWRARLSPSRCKPPTRPRRSPAIWRKCGPPLLNPSRPSVASGKPSPK